MSHKNLYFSYTLLLLKPTNLNFQINEQNMPLEAFNNIIFNGIFKIPVKTTYSSNTLYLVFSTRFIIKFFKYYLTYSSYIFFTNILHKYSSNYSPKLRLLFFKFIITICETINISCE